MLTLGLEIQSTVWNLLDWSSSVPELGKALIANEAIGTKDKGVILRQLAELSEFCVLDPEVAVGFYSSSYRCDRGQLIVLSRMRRLCHSMGRMDHAARTAELEYRRTKEPHFHAIAGRAWLDAGQPDQALKPLLLAEVHAPQDVDVGECLEVARREWANPQHKANALLNKAKQGGSESARDALKAARIFRLLDIEDERYEESLKICLADNPNGASPSSLMEHFLFTSDRLDELADHFRRRAKAASDPDVAARVLFEGSSLLFRANAGSAGGPLFVEGLNLAVQINLRSIPGLLAQLRGLVASAARERKQVLKLANQAYSLLESPDEQVGVSIFCAQIARHAQKDEEETRFWLVRLKEFVDDHVLLKDFNTL